MLEESRKNSFKSDTHRHWNNAIVYHCNDIPWMHQSGCKHTHEQKVEALFALSSFLSLSLPFSTSSPYKVQRRSLLKRKMNCIVNPNILMYGNMPLYDVRFLASWAHARWYCVLASYCLYVALVNSKCIIMCNFSGQRVFCSVQRISLWHHNSWNCIYIHFVRATKQRLG